MGKFPSEKSKSRNLTEKKTGFWQLPSRTKNFRTSIKGRKCTDFFIEHPGLWPWGKVLLNEGFDSPARHLNTFNVHPNLRNINLHDITCSLMSQNPKERIFVVQIALFVVTFLSLVSKFLFLMHTTKKSTHTLALHHVPICGVSPSYSSSSYATC